MKCPRCGVEVKKNHYCSNCGAALTDYQETTRKSNQTDFNYEENISNDELLDAFMGPNAYIIRRGQFSLPALIFGPFYFMTRKLYKWGFLLLFLEGCLEGLEFSAIFVFVRISLAFYFNKIYIAEASRRIETIKRENPNASQTGLLNIVKDRGGFSLVVPICMFIIYFMIVFLFILFMFGLFDDELENDYKIPVDERHLYYNIPEGFYELGNSPYTKTYTIEDQKCSFKVAKSNQNEKSTGLEELGLIKLEESYKDKFIEINDYLWNESMNIGELEKTYLLKTDVDSITYSIEFKLTLDEEHTYCEDSFEYLKESLEIDE